MQYGRATIGVAFGYITHRKANRQSIMTELSVRLLNMQNCQTTLPIHKREVGCRWKNIIYIFQFFITLFEWNVSSFSSFRSCSEEWVLMRGHSDERRSCKTLLYIDHGVFDPRNVRERAEQVCKFADGSEGGIREFVAFHHRPIEQGWWYVVGVLKRVAFAHA